jgi:hypothetical protein
MSKELGANFERYNGKSYIHWYCKKTGEVLDTVEAGGARVEGEVPLSRLDDEPEPARCVEHSQDQSRQDDTV